MKNPLPIALIALAGVFGCPQYAAATPVLEEIPESVDWFTHIDVDQLRSSHAGGLLMNELMALDPLKEQKQLPINPIQVINGLRGITAFGTMPDLANGAENVDVVTVISGTPELIQIFKGMLSGFQLEKPDAIDAIMVGDRTVLSMKEAGIAGLFLDDGTIALSKSMDSMTRYLDVVDGNAPNVQFGKRFPLPQDSSGMGVYLGAYVNGLNQFENLPAQARILQLTQAVAVQLGESDMNLHLLVSLVTDQPQTAQQVREVLQGIIAMLVLTQNGQPDVAALIQSARVSQEANAVSLRVDYPATSAEKWIHMLTDKIRAELEKANEPEAEESAEVEVETDIDIEIDASISTDEETAEEDAGGKEG